MSRTINYTTRTFAASKMDTLVQFKTNAKNGHKSYSEYCQVNGAILRKMIHNKSHNEQVDNERFYKKISSIGGLRATDCSRQIAKLSNKSKLE